MNICMPVIAAMSLAAHVFAATIDEVRLGDAASEKAHAFADGAASFAENGARGEPCRRLRKPDGPARWRTEPMRFRVKVAKFGPTYLTCRLWGGDVSHDHIFVTVDGKMLGQMHLGEYDLLDYESCWPRDSERTTADAEHFGAFTYRTFLLPDNLTSGKSDVEIAVYACGHVWGYGNDFEQFQKPVMHDSRGLYAFATHTESLWEGVAAKEPPKPSPAAKASAKDPDVDSLRARIDRSLAKLMSPGELAKRWKDAGFLAEAYNTKGCAAYKSKDALAAIVAFVDAESEEESRNPGFSAKRDPWCCSGSAALAVGRVGASAIAPYLEDPQRRARWREYFLSGVDYLSSHRRFFANQSQIVDTYAHWCNRALKICDPKAGPPLAETRGRLAEAMGLRPMPNGYVALTKAGLSKEDGYVGSYGESTVWASANAYEASCDEEMPDGDEALLAQLRKATRARLYMRYPGVRRDGRRVARLEAQTSWRNEHFPPPPTYLTNGIDLRNAILAKDPAVVGAVRDMYDDGVVAEYAASAKDTDIAALRFLSDWPKVRRAIEKFGDRLPHMPCFGGDFEWCDPENALVVVKHGDEMLFVEAYWRARGGVNGLAKVHFVSPTAEISATVECEQRFEAKGGKVERIGDWFQYGWMGKLYPGYRDDFGSGEKWPPHNALAGAERPVAENGGRAEFYVVRFGRYTVAVNDSSKGHDYYFSAPRGMKVKVAPKSFKVIVDEELRVPAGRLAYVREGPAKIVDGRIVICDMPEHARKPIPVVVCIYDENRAMRPQLQRIVIER